MLIDLHAHTSGISTCCRVPAPEIIKAAQDAGIDGIVLSNHYQRHYVKDGDAAAFAERYVKEYEYTKACGDAAGFRVFYGMELTMELHSGAHILVYGVDPSFTLKYPETYAMTMADLFLSVGILVNNFFLLVNETNLYSAVSVVLYGLYLSNDTRTSL